VSDSPLLDRAGIEEAFRRLGDRLARRGVVADLYVFGGAAMALAYDSRRATRDVDALFKPHGIVLEEAMAVAAELGLPRWWLNEQASSYVAPGGDSAASRVFDHPGLRVFAASPEHLLAMKAFAARPRDAEDIRQLTQVLGLQTVDDVLASVREVFPEEEPPARLRLLLEDIFSEQEELAGRSDAAFRVRMKTCVVIACTVGRVQESDHDDDGNDIFMGVLHPDCELFGPLLGPASDIVGPCPVSDELTVVQ
jgi:predicted nucleotidyltransferase